MSKTVVFGSILDLTEIKFSTGGVNNQPFLCFSDIGACCNLYYELIDGKKTLICNYGGVYIATPSNTTQFIIALYNNINKILIPEIHNYSFDKFVFYMMDFYGFSLDEYKPYHISELPDILLYDDELRIYENLRDVSNTIKLINYITINRNPPMHIREKNTIARYEGEYQILVNLEGTQEYIFFNNGKRYIDK